MLEFGDWFGAIATPAARLFGADCIDPETKDLRKDSPCARRKARMNQVGEKISNFFINPEQRKKGETMKFRCQLMVIVDADKAEDVIGKIKPAAGEIHSYQVSPITVTPPPTVRQTGMITAPTSGVQAQKG